METMLMLKSRLQYWREKRFWSIRKLATLSNVHVNTIIDIEKNRRKPREETAKKLADALGITIGDLVEDDT